LKHFLNLSSAVIITHKLAGILLDGLLTQAWRYEQVWLLRRLRENSANGKSS